MRKPIRIILMASLASLSTLLLSSCSLAGEIMNNSPLFKSDASIANERFEQILDACQKQDATALKEMFSEKAISEAANFDDSITALFDFFQGEVTTYENVCGGPKVEQANNEDGTNRKWKKMSSSYDFETNEQKYRLAFEEYVVDTANADNIGIYSLYIIKAEDSKTEFAYWGGWEFNPGIVIEKGD